MLFASNTGGTRVLGYALERTGWTGRVVFFQPGEYQPNALDNLAGRDFRILANAIVYAVHQEAPSATSGGGGTSGGAGGSAGAGTGGASGAVGADGTGKGGATSAGGATPGTGGSGPAGGSGGSGGSTTPGAGGATSGNGGGSTPMGGQSGGSSNDTDDGGGCACAAAPSARASWLALAAIALALRGRARGPRPRPRPRRSASEGQRAGMAQEKNGRISLTQAGLPAVGASVMRTQSDRTCVPVGSESTSSAVFGSLPGAGARDTRASTSGQSSPHAESPTFVGRRSAR